MLTNKEFSAANKVPATLPRNIEPFAMFTVDLGEVKTCVGRNASGKRIMKFANPHLQGKDANLWDVVPVRVEMTIAEMRKASEDERIAQAIADKAEREERIKMYAERVARDLPIFDNDDEEDNLSADEKFFSIDVELVGGRCRRKGGIKNHAGFESLVDG